jgi:hypothetical protein
MTAKKPNPAKRGRKTIPRRIHRLILLRWNLFKKAAKRKAPDRPMPAIAEEFIAGNQSWFRAHSIAPGDYDTLLNHLKMGKRETARLRVERLQNWGVVTDLLGRKTFSTKARYLKHTQMVALGVRPN